MDDQQLLRYSRHILLSEIGIEGQQHLLDARVLIIGLGGLGSPAALYLAASGVGQLTLCDHDTVDFSNLQRQIIHRTSSVGLPKVASAQAALRDINPEVECIALPLRADEAQLRDLVAVYEVDLRRTAPDEESSYVPPAGWRQFLLFFDFEALTDNVVFISFFFYGLSALGLLVLRRTHPHLHRPYRVWGYPYVPIAYVAVAFSFVGYLVYDQVVNFSGDNFNRVFSLLVVVAGLPIYFWYRRQAALEAKRTGQLPPPPMFGPDPYAEQREA